MELADVALSVFATMLVGIVVVAGASIGWDTLAKKMALHGGVQRMGPTSRNLVQAFAVCLGAFVFPKPKPKPNPKPNPKPKPNQVGRYAARGPAGIGQRACAALLLWRARHDRRK